MQRVLFFLFKSSRTIIISPQSSTLSRRASSKSNKTSSLFSLRKQDCNFLFQNDFNCFLQVIETLNRTELRRGASDDNLNISLKLSGSLEGDLGACLDVQKKRRIDVYFPTNLNGMTVFLWPVWNGFNKQTDSLFSYCLSLYAAGNSTPWTWICTAVTVLCTPEIQYRITPEVTEI